MIYLLAIPVTQISYIFFNGTKNVHLSKTLHSIKAQCFNGNSAVDTTILQ